MKNISDYYGQTLIFTQPSVWKRAYIIKCNDEVIANINSVKLFGLKLEVEMFGDKWTIYRPSIWKSEVAITEANKTYPIAKYRKEKFKLHGFVELPKGEKLKIVFKFLRNIFEIYNSSDELLVKFKSKVKFKETIEIVFEKKSELIGKYPWVIVLACYLSLERKRSAGAGAAG
jgi:hypothetical protein